MSAYLMAPLLLVALSLGWFSVQRAWLIVMRRPADGDALDRPGGCGGRRACRGDCPGRSGVDAGTSIEEQPR